MMIDSADSAARGWIGFMPAALLRDYDIVSWDPRGVGQSTAVQCFPSGAAEAAFLGSYADFPVTASQQAGFTGRWAAFGKICAARNGDLLEHVSTADTALRHGPITVSGTAITYTDIVTDVSDALDVVQPQAP
jgi:pimeloyl-ACP methyl ester carboxylesterase